jgi:hypothetical protein
MGDFTEVFNLIQRNPALIPHASSPVAPPATSLVRTDNFNRANSANLGANWTALDGNIEIISNQAGLGTDGFNVVYWSADAFNANQYSKITITNSPFNPNIAIECSVRVSGTAGAGNYNYYAGWATNGQYGIYKQVGATSTDLVAPTSHTWNVGDVIELRVNGTTLTLHQNGSQIASITDSDLSSGRPGINMFAGNGEQPRADNWEGGEL